MKFRTFLLALIVATFFIGVSAPKAHADAPTFYGGIIAELFMTSKDSDAGTGGESDADTTLELNGALSKFGLKGKAGNTSYVVELGIKGKDNSDTVYLRQAFMKVPVGPATLLAGQTYAPSFMLGTALYGTTVLAGTANGSLYGGRIPQVRLSVMGVTLALIQPSSLNTVTGGATDTTLPKLSISYDGKAGPLGFGLGFGYNSVKIDDGSAFDGDSVDSYVAWARVKFKQGPIGFKAQFGYSQNNGNYLEGYPEGGSNTGAGMLSVAQADGTDIENTTGFGFIAVASYNFGMGVFELGGGWESSKNGAAANTDDTTALQVYTQVKIGLDKHFFVVPGYYYSAQGKNGQGTEVGTTQYYGLAFIGTF